jgi:CubicO group peptidase (beta-lactamase class C family)
LLTTVKDLFTRDDVEDIRSVISDLMRIGGTPSISLAVMAEGKTWYQNLQHPDMEPKDPVDSDTNSPACSLTKAVTAAALGLLIEERKDISWDFPVRQVLPDFKPTDKFLDKVTIQDLLCHRSGMLGAFNLMYGSNSSILIPGKHSLEFLNHRETVPGLQHEYAYNNLGYEILGKAITSMSGHDYSEFVQDRIFEPLGMTRTFLKTPNGVSNVAKCYNVLDDGKATWIKGTDAGNDGFGAASGGMRTTVKDLVQLYRAFLEVDDESFNPLKQIPELFKPRIAMRNTGSSYALGWATTQLPSSQGIGKYNDEGFFARDEAYKSQCSGKTPLVIDDVAIGTLSDPRHTVLH